MKITNPALLRIAPAMETIQKHADQYYNRGDIDTDAYHGILTAMRRAQMDIKHYSAVDRLLLSCILRLDRARVYIVDGQYNSKMGSTHLVAAMYRFDYEAEGDLAFVRNAAQMKFYTADQISKTMVMLQVAVDAKYGEVRGKREMEYTDLFNALDKIDDPRMRCWVSKNARRQIQDNAQFAHFEGYDKAIPYLDPQDIPTGTLQNMLPPEHPTAKGTLT